MSVQVPQPADPTSEEFVEFLRAYPEVKPIRLPHGDNPICFRVDGVTAYPGDWITEDLTVHREKPRSATRNEWVAALRSGKYKQGVGRLRRSDEFCCLGVLCEVVGEKAVLDDHTGHYQYCDKGDLAPTKVKNVVGLSSHSGRFATFAGLPEETKRKLRVYGVNTCAQNTLAALNDAGVPFSVIADIIEAEPEGLFEDE